MKLESLELKGFRTYVSLALEFPARLTFIIGPNANGKTNILEAIGMLSFGKSFRGAPDIDLVNHAGSAYHVSGRFEKRGRHFELALGCDISGSKLRRRIVLNGKQLAGRAQMIGHLVSVIMSPADILIVDGGPAYRRRFLDQVLSYQNPDYLRDLLSYNRALRQRNALLKKIKGQRERIKELGPWQVELARFGDSLTRARQRFVSEFQDTFRESLGSISNTRDEIGLRLEYSAEREPEGLQQALDYYVSRDIALGHTTVGPHRQNLLFERDRMDITRFGSQGQKRSLVLALRIAQFSFLRERLDLPPVLLIDDVIRELDAARRAAFVTLLRSCGQAIFTTPDLDGLMIDDFQQDSAVLRVTSPGRVESLSK
ncbi:MAG: DNA replication and repair protein RecF [Spirochaetales bacterium]|nr:DNA replication and repair protein RecF [Leptospiraceae bacterium]MCP5482261.1 DNA replication and repair protein RecF [Spirochaetales bacterium]MCP5484627.1 DNA replication and repair protein RecF [Spirochaetales bacterium]